jgi:hypothetical protein
MDQTRHKPPLRQSTHEIFFSDEVAANRQQQDAAQDFQSQLKAIISSNQADALEQLVQQHPEAWAHIRRDELGEWLLVAVKKGHLDIVDALVRKSVPGTAAAIPLDIQLALVEAACCERNSEPEMSLLLNALLQAVDCPVQHLGLLVNRAKQGKYFAIATSLFTYKENFVKARDRQPCIPSMMRRLTAMRSGCRKSWKRNLGFRPSITSLLVLPGLSICLCTGWRSFLLRARPRRWSTRK